VTEVRWTTQATDDLQAIYDFIGRDSEQYAQVIVEGILAAIDLFFASPRQLYKNPSGF
jgi:plasmid stabilization system protein ParE